MKNVIRTCALGVGVAAMFAASAFATSFESKRVSIPFEFRVAKVTMPAGEYKLQETPGAGIAYLVNIKTGQQVQMLLTAGGRTEGKVKLVFETAGGTYSLKGIQ